MCSSRGKLQTAASQTSLRAGPTGEPLWFNLSFHWADKQEFPESHSPSPPKFTWRLGDPAHASARGQIKCEFADIPDKENDRSFSKNIPLWETMEMHQEEPCRHAPWNVHVCTHGNVIISCCYRDTVWKWDLKWLSCLPSSSSPRVTHHCQQPAKQDEIKF